MTSSARLLATILLLAPLASACGKKEEQPPASTRPASPTPAVAATEAPAAPVTTTPQPARKAATQPAALAPPTAQRPKGKITLPAKLGAVTFDHENHAGKLGIACTTCHHPSRPQKPLTSETQACRDCHRSPAAPPMKTSLQAAFHDPKGATGTCIACHKQKGGSAPVRCLDCHKKK